MLVLFDETVQQLRISPAKATSDSAGLGLHPVHEVAGGRVHVSWYTGEHLKKMHNGGGAPPFGRIRRSACFREGHGFQPCRTDRREALPCCRRPAARTAD